MKTIVIYHSADFDGLFCKAIAEQFGPPGATFIGWDHGDPQIAYQPDTLYYILDLNPDCMSGVPEFTAQVSIIWIDHHKTAIEKWSPAIPGYRIDGVAACRLTYQWFQNKSQEEPDRVPLPTKEDYVSRHVFEPRAVMYAGEYDVNDKRDPDAELFQFGLRSVDLDSYCSCVGVSDWWIELVSPSVEGVKTLLKNAGYIKCYRDAEYKDVITSQGFDIIFEELSFLACCSHGCDIRSQLFEAGIKPYHDGLLGFTFNGVKWRVSLYGVPGKPEIDLSAIAKKHGGGGHKQACGFVCSQLPWLAEPSRFKI